MKKKLILLPISTALIALGTWLIIGNPPRENSPNPAIPKENYRNSAPQEIAKSFPNPNNLKNQNQPPQSNPPLTQTEKAPPQDPDTVKITLKAGESNYETRIPSSSTVYDAMTALSSATSFKFGSKYYSGLGYFVESINGIKNGDGAYWTLYVNEKYSPVGASDRKLKDGDMVEWKYEKK